MNVSGRVKNNEQVQRIKRYYKNGSMSFLECIWAIDELFEVGAITSDEAELVIRQIVRMRKPH